MIVNPQVFNYRLIISSLLVVLTALGIYSYNNYNSIKSYEEFLKQEKYLIEKELSEMLASYDELSEDYDLMASQLQEAKLETKTALDSLRLLKSDLSIISKFKDQLLVLKSKSRVLLGAIDSLNTANTKLQQEKRYALNTIERKTLTINELEKTNSSLNKTIDEASLIKASEVRAQAYKLKSGNKKRFTERARRADAIDVCVELNENALTKKENKEIFVQIVDPQGNVLANKGEAFFGNTSLIYSQKENFNFDNRNLEFCTAIVAEDKDQPLSKGYYFISVFHKDRKIGGTSIKLK